MIHPLPQVPLTPYNQIQDLPRPPVDLRVRFKTFTRLCLALSEVDSDEENDDTLTEDTDSDTDGDSEEGEGEEGIILIESPKGYRLVDVELLSESIASNLSYKFCNSSVQLYEVGIKGLARKFVFSL